MLRKNFEHSSDQVTFRTAISRKITITVTEVVLIQVFVLIIGSKKNYNWKHHSSVSSTQKWESHFSLVWVMEFSVISLCLSQIFSNNSSRAILIDVQRLHGNGKWIICVSNGAYTLFNKTFLLLLTGLSKCFIQVRVRAS